MSEISETSVITIAGAGLAGSLLAVFLARRGFHVEVFERWPDPRRHETPAGRSINLALAERGIYALKQVGLHHRVAQFAIPMRGRMIHDEAGHQALQPYSSSDREVIYSVHRVRLNIALLDAAEETNRVHIHFRQELKSVDFDRGLAVLLDHASGREYSSPVLPLIAADGAGSPVRAALEKYLGFEASIELLDHGYQELSIRPSPSGQHRLNPNALHIWPRGGYMMIALPNADGSFTATLFLANKSDQTERPSFASLEKPAAFRDFCNTRFPDLTPLLERLDSEHAEHPVGVLGTVRCPQWHLDGRAVLIGDAAHAIVPFHGQGMNCAFEDCLTLDAAVAESKSWPQAFARFTAARRDNANAIADMALENYLEMRSAVIDSRFQLKRELGHELERRHPRHFLPRYSMVMFQRLPYREAQRRGAINERILEHLIKGVERLEQVDFDRARELVETQLNPLDGSEKAIIL